MTTAVLDAEAEQAAFDALIEADQRIEPRDWMPDAYRKASGMYCVAWQSQSELEKRYLASSRCATASKASLYP